MKHNPVRPAPRRCGEYTVLNGLGGMECRDINNEVLVMEASRLHPLSSRLRQPPWHQAACCLSTYVGVGDQSTLSGVRVMSLKDRLTLRAKRNGRGFSREGSRVLREKRRCL